MYFMVFFLMMGNSVIGSLPWKKLCTPTELVANDAKHVIVLNNDVRATNNMLRIVVQ